MGKGRSTSGQKSEIDRVLGADAPLFCHYYGVEEGGNVPYDPQMEFGGKNILYVAQTVAETARLFQRDETSVKLSLALARTTLLDERRRRPRPHRDDKVITSWNGLMIAALCPGRHGAGRCPNGWMRQHVPAASSSRTLRDPGHRQPAAAVPGWGGTIRADSLTTTRTWHTG